MEKEDLILSCLQDLLGQAGNTNQRLEMLQEKTEEMKQEIKNLNEKVGEVEKSLNERIDKVEKRIDEVERNLNEKIDSVERALDTEIDSVYHIALENRRNIQLLLIPVKGANSDQNKHKLQTVVH